MNKLLLIAAFWSFALNTSGQIVELQGEENIFYGTIADETDIHIAWDVINATGQTIDMRCRREGVLEVPGSVNQFCWGILCSPFGTGVGYSSEIVTLSPGEMTASFYANFRHNGNAGHSIIKYCYYDGNNEANEFCYDVNFCVDADCVVSVPDKETANIKMIAPNPASSICSIQYHYLQAPTAGKLTIYNSTGVLVKEIALTQTNGLVLIDAVDFENGVYFCNIEENGQVHNSQRLVIVK